MEIQTPAEINKNEGSNDDKSVTNNVAIENFQYYGNDLTELRKIAELSPELAEKIVNQRDRQDARENTSFRLGLISTILLVVFAIGALTFMVVQVGVIAMLLAIMGIFAIALLVRVVLTGEWSDTSWFGAGVTGLVKLLGGKPGKDGD